MKIDPFALSATLRQQLTGLPQQRQLFFGLWCLEVLWPLYGPFIAKRLDHREWLALQSCSETLWSEALGGPSVDVQAKTVAALAAIDWGEDSDYQTITEDEEFQGAIDLADGFEKIATKRDADAYSGASTTVLNRLASHLSLVRDMEDPTADPLFETELNHQAVVLDLLMSGAPLTPQHRTWGRNRALLHSS